MRFFSNILRKTKNNLECFWYLVINALSLLIVAVLRLIPNTDNFFDIFNAENPASDTIITVVITIVTLVAALESLITQLYFNRRTKRYFSKTPKNIVSIVLFAVYGLIFSFKIDKTVVSTVVVMIVLAVIIFLIFFVYDLATIDVSRFIKKQIEAIVESIKNCSDKSIEQTESKLMIVYKDSLLNNDTFFVEQVIRRTPSIVRTILENKFKNENMTEEKSPLRKSMDYVYALYSMCLELCKDDSKEYLSKRLIISSAIIVELLIKYGNQSLIEKSIDKLLTFVNDSDKPSEMVDYFASYFLRDEVTKSAETNAIMKRIEVCYQIYNPKYINYKLNVTTDFIARITNLFENKTLGNIDNQFYELLKSIATNYMSTDKPNEVVCSTYLFDLWKSISDKDTIEEFKKYIGLKNKESNFRANSKNCLIIDVLIHKIVKSVSDSDKVDYYSICLENLCISVYYFKEEQYSKPLPFNADCLNKCFDKYLQAYKEISRHANPNVFMIYFDALNDFGVSLEKRNKEDQKKILEIYSETLLSLSNIESSDRVSDVERHYRDFIKELDKNDKISADLETIIIDNFFYTVHDMINCQSPHTHLVYEDVYLFGGDECKLRFILNKKSSKYELLCSQAKNIATIAREYQNNEIIKISSGFIGWSLYSLLQEKSEAYKTIFMNSAYQLFRILIELDSNDDIINFVGTLFVINLTYCFSLQEGDSRYKFASTRLQGFSDSQLLHIKKAIILRKYAKEWKYMNAETFSKGIKELESHLSSLLS